MDNNPYSDLAIYLLTSNLIKYNLLTYRSTNGFKVMLRHNQVATKLLARSLDQLARLISLIIFPENLLKKST